MDRYVRDFIELPLARMTHGAPVAVYGAMSALSSIFNLKGRMKRPALAFALAGGVLTAAASPVFKSDLTASMATASPRAEMMRTSSEAALTSSSAAPAVTITTPTMARVALQEFDPGRLVSAFVPAALLPENAVTPMLLGAPIPQIEPQAQEESQDVPLGEPLVSNYAAGRWHLRAALRRSQGRMERLGITRDTVIAVHNGRPITLKAALSDRDIHQVPPVAVFEEWCASLSRYGFERRPYDVSAYERAWGLPRRTLSALRSTESGGFMSAVSFARDGGALGPFQIMWQTAQGLDVSDPFDPHQAATGAARYMRGAIIASNGNLTQAFARYNTGHGNVNANIRRNGRFVLARALPETRGHATRAVSYMGRGAETPAAAIQEIVTSTPEPVIATGITAYAPAM